MKKPVVALVCLLLGTGFLFGGATKPVISTIDGVVMSFTEAVDGHPAMLDLKIGTGNKRMKLAVDSKTLIAAKDRKVTTAKVLRIGLSVTVKYSVNQGLITATFIQLN